MLEKSTKYGTILTVGPRLRKLIRAGVASDLLWSENYPDQEEPTQDERGEFQRTREWIEVAPLEDLFDLWCRGNNLIGYAGKLLRAAEVFRKVAREKL